MQQLCETKHLQVKKNANSWFGSKKALTCLNGPPKQPRTMHSLGTRWETATCVDFSSRHSWIQKTWQVHYEYFTYMLQDRSIDSFERALQQKSPEFINPDLHVNFAEALTYKQDYPAALTTLTRAVDIEPHFETAKERSDLLRTFLYRLHESVAEKR